MKKMFLFACLFFFLLLSSFVFATQFELLENTSQCLTDCFAKIRVFDLSPAVTISPLPSNANKDFNLSFVKSLNSQTDLLSFDLKICSFNDVNNQISVYDNKIVLVHNSDKNCNKGVPSPIGIEQCPDYNSTIKVFSHYIGKIDNVYSCEDFYKKQLISAKEYFIEIRGKKKPMLVSDAKEDKIDWQLTFAGTTLKQWAWWNNNWKNKKPIQICANTDLNVGQLIWIKNTNFSTMNVLANLADVRIIDEQTNTELSRLVEGTSATSTDGNIFFAIDKNILKGSCDKNYFVYYNNTSAGTIVNYAGNIETFERYSTSDTAPFSYWFSPAGGGTAGIKINPKKNGNQAFYYQTGGGTSYIWGKVGNYTPPYYDVNLGNRTFDYNAWVRINNTSPYFFSIGDFGDSRELNVMFNAGTVSTGVNGTPISVLGLYSAETWYQINIKYQWNAITFDTCIFSETALVGCVTGDATGGFVPTIWVVGSTTGGGTEGYLDDATWFNPYETNVSLETAQTIPSDITPPTIMDFNVSFSNSLGWFASTTQTMDVNLRCSDNNSYSIYYLIKNNDTNFYADFNVSNTLVNLKIPITNKNNFIVVKCTDANNNQASTSLIKNFGFSCFNLVDEETGGVFDLTGIIGLRASVLDKNYSYDFKTNNKTSQCLNTSDIIDTVRFDFNYIGGTSFFKEFTLSQLDINTPVCAAQPQQFYQSAVVSVAPKAFSVKNNLVNCYASNTFTKYTYSTNFYEPIYTINAPYYLYLTSGTSFTLLALLDGARTDVIYLDVLASSLQNNYISIPFEDVYFYKSPAPSEAIIIYYKNWKQNSIQTDFIIYDAATVPIFSYSEFLSPNDLNIIFDYSTLTLDKNILSLQVVKHLADGTTESYYKYFNTQAQTGLLNPVIPAVLSIALMIFGLTMTSTRTSFGFVGIAICIISLFILTLTPLIWYIGFLEGVIVLCFLYIVITFKKENLAVT